MTATTPEHASDVSGEELHAVKTPETESDKLIFSTTSRSTHAEHATMYGFLPHPVISPNLAEITQQQENLTHSGVCSGFPIGKGIMILTSEIKHRKETKIIKLERIVYLSVG